MAIKVHVYDSALGEEYPHHRIYAVAYEPIWQALRTELHWASDEAAEISYMRCVAYVGLGKDAETANRTWRVFNLLCAIPHGQVRKNEIHYIELGASKFLLRAQEEFRKRLKETGYPTEWDWHVTRVAATRMDLGTLATIVKPLAQNRAARVDAKPELRHYLAMMADIVGDLYPRKRIRNVRVQD